MISKKEAAKRLSALMPKITIVEMALISALLGVIVAILYHNAQPALLGLSTQANAVSSTNAIYFVGGMVAILAVTMFVIHRYGHRHDNIRAAVRLYNYYMAVIMAISFSTLIVIYAYKTPTLALIGGWALIVFGILLFCLRLRNPNAISFIFAVWGIGVLGSGLSPLIAGIALLILSIYDYIAVFKTKTMLSLAKGVIYDKDGNIAPLMGVFMAGNTALACGNCRYSPIPPAKNGVITCPICGRTNKEGKLTYPGNPNYKRLKAWKDFKAIADFDSPKARGFSMLGLGDVIFPIAFITSVYIALGSISLLTALFIGYVTAIMVDMAISGMLQRPIPALPVIAAVLLPIAVIWTGDMIFAIILGGILYGAIGGYQTISAISSIRKHTPAGAGSAHR